MSIIITKSVDDRCERRLLTTLEEASLVSYLSLSRLRMLRTALSLRFCLLLLLNHTWLR
jgi:hypothetical protein